MVPPQLLIYLIVFIVSHLYHFLNRGSILQNFKYRTCKCHLIKSNVGPTDRTMAKKKKKKGKERDASGKKKGAAREWLSLSLSLSLSNLKS